MSEIKSRRGGNIRNQRVTHPRKAARRSRALARQQASAEAGLTPQKQLEYLDAAFGKGTGATKERAKLNAQIAAAKAAQQITKKKEKAQ